MTHGTPRDTHSRAIIQPTGGESERFEPWFGAWPPEFRGRLDEDEMEKNKWSKLMPNILALAALIIGLLLFYIAHAHLDGQPEELLAGLGIACMIAGIIGLTIDLALRKRIAHDVFEVAFGYILPKELREEMRWLYDLQLLATDHNHKFTITRHKESNNKVILNEIISRTIENFTDRSIKVPFDLGIQEWFHSEGRSQIKSCTFTLGDKSWSIADKKLETFKLNNHILAIRGKTKSSFKLRAKEKFTMVATIEEIKYQNDQTWTFFSAATRNPYIIVEVDADIDIDVTFLNREQAQLQNLGNNNFRLNGTLLPDQGIRIRWWNKDESEKWFKE